MGGEKKGLCKFCCFIYSFLWVLIPKLHPDLFVCLFPLEEKHFIIISKDHK